MNTRSGENAAKKRKVRKGTHSCWECRRRKVKCNFASPYDIICITCCRRGTKCASQTEVNRPETADNDSGYTERIDDGQLVSVGGDNTDNSTQQAHSPLTPTPARNFTSVAETNTHSRITQTLLHSLPTPNDMKILLNRINKISLLSYQSNYKTRSPTPEGIPKEQILVANLMYPEAHPVLLARQMLLFAVALQHVSPNAVFPGLTKHHHLIMEELAESAIKAVTTNDALLGTLEGLENIILEGYYHVDCGNIRRSWITMRRAVMAAQLLGLHTPGQGRFKTINHENDLDPGAIWICIMSMERSLSLLLGLPTSIGTANSTVPKATSASEKEMDFPTGLMGITAKILERNQIHCSQKALNLSREIDREMIRVAEQMSSSFWSPPAFAGLEIDSAEAFLETRRNLDHICYHTMMNQLHLPYILCPNKSPQSNYSKIACVNASREILTREIAIRTFNPVTVCSRMGDFLALIAGMTLMLAHIVGHCHEEVENIIIHQRLSDRATVKRALECMKSMSELQDDVLAARCSVVLRDLLAVEADAAQARTRYTRKQQETDVGYEDDRHVLIINVPYLGAIKIASEGTISKIPIHMVQDRQHADHNECVTIGGIGSLHVKSPKLPASGEVAGTTEAATSYEAPAAEASDAPPSTQSKTANYAQSTPGDFLAQQDQMFPDAAAGLDDWVFQGFDTAFFDVLMRGAGDLQPNGTNAESWDF